MSDLSSLADPELKRIADQLTKNREEYEAEERQELLLKMEKLFNHWRHHAAGWDTTQGPEDERADGFERALELLSECYEELRGD